MIFPLLGCKCSVVPPGIGMYLHNVKYKISGAPRKLTPSPALGRDKGTLAAKQRAGVRVGEAPR